MFSFRIPHTPTFEAIAHLSHALLLINDFPLIYHPRFYWITLKYHSSLEGVYLSGRSNQPSLTRSVFGQSSRGKTERESAAYANQRGLGKLESSLDMDAVAVYVLERREKSVRVCKRERKANFILHPS